MSDVERIARDRAEIEADLDRIARETHGWVDASYRIWADVPDLLAALDEANTERDRLAKDNERCSEAWRRVVLRQQRTDNAHDYDMQQIEAERDRAVAQVQRVEALIGEAGRWYDEFHLTLSTGDVRAALAGEGSEQP